MEASKLHTETTIVRNSLIEDGLYCFNEIQDLIIATRNFKLVFKNTITISFIRY